MEIYIALFFYVIIIGIIIFSKKNLSPKSLTKQKKVFLLMVFIPLFLIMGYRGVTVGTDTNLYEYLYNVACNRDLSYIFIANDNSPLYTLYSIFIGKIFGPGNAITVINSFIILLLTAIFIYKNSNHVVISTLLFLEFYHYFYAFNISRQYLAILIIANAFVFLNKKNIWKYLFCCLCATLVHATSIVSLIFIPLMYLDSKNYKKIEKIYFISIIIILLLFNPIFNIFTSIFPHYSVYISASATSRGRRWILYLMYLIFSLLFYILRKRKVFLENEVKEINSLNLINIVGILLGFFSLNIDVFSRLCNYFFIFIIIFIPKLFDKFKNIKTRVLLYVLLIIIMFVPMIILLKDNNGEILPYINILFN